MEARIMRQWGSALGKCEVPREECNPLKFLENLAKDFYMLYRSQNGQEMTSEWTKYGLQSGNGG